MKTTLRALLALALAASAVPAFGQTLSQNLPANTVVGRLGAGTSGPAQAIPFTSLANNLYPTTFYVGAARLGSWNVNYAYGTGESTTQTPLQSVSPYGGASIYGASRTSDGNGGSSAAVGSINWGFNDRSAADVFAWGDYSECRDYSGGGCHGVEINSTNLTGSTAPTTGPYTPYKAGHIDVLNLASGGDCSGTCFVPKAIFTGSISGTTLIVTSVKQGTIAIGHTILGPGITGSTTITAGSGLSWTVSASQTVASESITSGLNNGTAGTVSEFLSIIANGSDSLSGLNFGYNALSGNDGKGSGIAPAIKFPQGDYLGFYYCSNTASYPTNCGDGSLAAQIRSDATAASMQIIFGNGALAIQDSATSSTGVNFTSIANAVNNFTIFGSIASAGPSITTTGSDTDIDINLTPKGAGKVSSAFFNAATGFRIANAATSGNVLRGNGTNFVSSTLAASDLSNGVVGSGAAVLAAGAPSTTWTSITNTSSTSSDPQWTLYNTTADASSGNYILQKSRSGGAVSANDVLGQFVFKGFDSASASQDSAFISAKVTAVGSGFVVSKLQMGLNGPTLMIISSTAAAGSATDADTSINIPWTTDATSSTAAAATIAGGLGVAKKIIAGDVITSTFFKTSTALIAAGGGSGNPAFVASSTGGTGQPTTANQNGWIKAQDSTGATIWIPVWK